MELQIYAFTRNIYPGQITNKEAFNILTRTISLVDVSLMETVCGDFITKRICSSKILMHACLELLCVRKCNQVSQQFVAKT